MAMEAGAEDRLLAGRARKPAVAVVAASSIEREADELARRAIVLHDRGTPFRQIRIALRDVSSYVPLLRATFESFGIPARFYFSDPLLAKASRRGLPQRADLVRFEWLGVRLGVGCISRASPLGTIR